MRPRLVTPTTHVIRQSTIIRYGYRRAKRDMAGIRSLRTCFFDGSPEFSDGKLRRLAQFYERLLLRGDFRRHRRNPGGNVLGNGLNSVPVTVQQIPGLDLQSTDRNRRADFDDVNIRVRD